MLPFRQNIVIFIRLIHPASSFFWVAIEKKIIVHRLGRLSEVIRAFEFLVICSGKDNLKKGGTTFLIFPLDRHDLAQKIECKVRKVMDTEYPQPIFHKQYSYKPPTRVWQVRTFHPRGLSYADSLFYTKYRRKGRFMKIPGDVDIVLKRTLRKEFTYPYCHKAPQFQTQTPEKAEVAFHGLSPHHLPQPAPLLPPVTPSAFGNPCLHALERQ